MLDAFLGIPGGAPGLGGPAWLSFVSVRGVCVCVVVSFWLGWVRETSLLLI